MTFTNRSSLGAIVESFRIKLPFLVAAFASFLLSVWLFFVQEEETLGIFVGIWVPSIHSLGTLMLTPDPSHSDRDSQNDSRRAEARS